jgi:hypothetical protein
LHLSGTFALLDDNNPRVVYDDGTGCRIEHQCRRFR